MSAQPPLPAPVYRTLIVVALAVLLLVAVLAARTGIADYWFRAAGNQAAADPLAAEAYLRNASLLRPGLAEYWRSLASTESLNQPDAALPTIRRALQLNPRDAESWYQLGLIEFQLGNSTAALRALQQAVQHNPKDEYSHFRFAELARALGRPELFASQLQAAAAVMDPGFVVSILSAGAAAGYSTRQLVALLPHDHPHQRAMAVLYFGWRHDWATASGIFLQLHPCTQAAAVSPCHEAATFLLSGLTRQARAGDAGDRMAALAWAPKVWDHALALHILSGSPALQGSLHDTDFQYPWLGVLFSWRNTHVLPAVVEPGAGRNGANAVRFDFSGIDSQQGSLLEQDVWVRPGRRYRLSLVSCDQAAPQQTGVSADVVTPAGAVLAQTALPLQRQWGPAVLDFTPPDSTPILTFRIVYSRPSGQTLLYSHFEIAALTMTALGGPPPLGKAASARPRGRSLHPQAGSDRSRPARLQTAGRGEQ